MRKWIGGSIIAALCISVAVNAFAAWTLLRVDELQWPKSGNPAITIFNGNAADGSLVVTGKIAQQRTGIDMWPVDDKLPALHALTESVWYATRFKDWPNFERFSISQMASAKEIRFGVERGGAGEFRNMIFCFEDVAPGQADCKLLITRNGVFVRNENQWVQIGE